MIEYMKKIREYIVIAGLLLIMWSGMYYMHHEVYLSRYVLEKPFGAALSWWDDVVISFCFFQLCTWGRRKWAFAATYVFLSLFVVPNVIYSRFFDQYITMDVLFESSNFQGTWWMSYVPLAFRWSDLLYVLLTCVFFYALRYVRNRTTLKESGAFLALMLLSLMTYVVVDVKEQNLSLKSRGAMRWWMEDNWFGRRFENRFNVKQEFSIAQYGILKTQLYCNLKRRMSDKLELSDSDLKQISDYIDAKKKKAGPTVPAIVKGTPNIIFILVESYISEASMLEVDGEEITPNLNKMMREKGVYSNLKVVSNKGAGESSDAQISYFTGLVPLKSDISVWHIMNHSFVALPKLLHDQKGYNTYITLPTGKYFWHQNEINVKYGIDNVIEAGNEANGYWCHDEEMMDLLQKESSSMKQPYMNIILTATMHGPYTEDFLSTTRYAKHFNYPKEYAPEYCHYFDKCYYTDAQIGRYINYLNKIGEYDKSLIVIASDHEVRASMLNMKKIPEDLPLIIKSPGIEPDKLYQGQINQIDLFPTMLDLMGIESQWRGIGESIVKKDYNNTITPDERHISDMIIMGNYFAKKLK